jgi:hypothetical protein
MARTDGLFCTTAASMTTVSSLRLRLVISIIYGEELAGADESLRRQLDTIPGLRSTQLAANPIMGERRVVKRR